MFVPAVAAGLLAVLAVFPARAAVTDGIVCQITGRATFAPALTTTQRATTVGFIGDVLPCQPGGVVSYGAIEATGSGSLSCLGGDGSGTATITWSDGSTSGAQIIASVRTPAIVIDGSFSSGSHFVGEQARAIMTGDVADASLPVLAARYCPNSAGGIGSAPFRGVVTIGEPD